MTGKINEIMNRDELVEEMLKAKGDVNNTIDLNAYGIGLIEMFDRLQGAVKIMKIKRATTEGLKYAEGDLFETNGMQFCLVENDGLYLSIELSTGCNVKSFDIDDYSKSEAIKLAKEEINRRTESEWKYALDKVSKDYCKRFNFRLPVNDPVT